MIDLLTITCKYIYYKFGFTCTSLLYECDESYYNLPPETQLPHYTLLQTYIKYCHTFTRKFTTFRNVLPFLTYILLLVNT